SIRDIPGASETSQEHQRHPRFIRDITGASETSQEHQRHHRNIRDIPGASETSPHPQVKMGHMTLTLLCLAAYILAVTPLEPDAVFRATTYINNNIFSGLQGEYAFFVKFTANECNGGLQEAALRTALRDISSRTVQNRLNSGYIYEGGRLVAAKPIESGAYTDHAEYRLLYPTAYSEHNDSPIGWLLRDAAE
ncbi:hypothetical protein GDO81_025008, partial [Engystomops pustulosus]